MKTIQTYFPEPRTWFRRDCLRDVLRFSSSDSEELESSWGRRFCLRISNSFFFFLPSFRSISDWTKQCRYADNIKWSIQQQQKILF